MVAGSGAAELRGGTGAAFSSIAGGTPVKAGMLEMPREQPASSNVTIASPEANMFDKITHRAGPTLVARTAELFPKNTFSAGSL